MIPHLAENPMKLGWLVPDVKAVVGFAKQEKIKKKNSSLLAIKINICEFRLTLLDHITWFQKKITWFYTNFACLNVVGLNLVSPTIYV